MTYFRNQPIQGLAGGIPAQKPRPLGRRKPFLSQMVPTLSTQTMAAGDSRQGLKRQSDTIASTATSQFALYERESFLLT